VRPQFENANDPYVKIFFGFIGRWLRSARNEGKNSLRPSFSGI
jgi:hypothetical protein